MVRHETITALKRFGMGPSANDALTIDGHAREWLLQQCDDPDVALIEDSRTQGSDALYRSFIGFRQMEREQGGRDDATAGMQGKQAGDRSAEAQRMERKLARANNPAFSVYRQEAELRVAKVVRTPAPFVERLVTFWADHFCVSAQHSGRIRVLTGANEREAIRPNVLGSFREMLHASARHPAMLLYLENARSRGPNSVAGQRGGNGLNENLAREILELHTLGVDGGYSQDDVTNFARILTGWSVRKFKHPLGGQFVFHKNWHEPGAFPLLGKTYDQDGMEKGVAALDDLARHPSTARHVADKLVAYFGNGTPIPALSKRLATLFMDTDGDLMSMSRALVLADELWEQPASKLLSPYEMMVAAGRALDWVPGGNEIVRALNLLGQPIWGPPSPAGWPDDSTTWLAADALLERLDWADQIASERAEAVDVRQLADALFGPALTDYTAQALRRAESRQQALALLLMSPEFQRR